MATPGSSAWRDEHWEACEPKALEVITVKPGIRLYVAKAAVPAFHVLFDNLAFWGYQARTGVTGSYNCRRITGGSSLSSHAYGTAVDVNWDTNPYVKNKLVTDMPRKMTTAIQEIVTVGGVRIWRWGGDWDHRPDTPHRYYDAMHFEIIAVPEQLAAGIDRTIDREEIALWPTLTLGAKGAAVRHLQELLEVHQDGDFGPKTQRAVWELQKSRGLTVDGVVGPATWTALHWHLPEVQPGDVRPDKQIAA